VAVSPLRQMDGVAGVDANEGLLFVGATNRPQELDDAARRRLSKRLLIPLPDADARREMLARGLAGLANSVSDQDTTDLLLQTDGYSGSDMAALCREAAMGPCRDPGFEAALMAGLSTGEMRPLHRADFDDALCAIRPSVGPGELAAFEDWNKSFGSFQNPSAMRNAGGAAKPPAA